MTRALVTGGGGFIGRRVCDKLARQAYEVIRVIRPGSGFWAGDGQQGHEPRVLHLDLLEPGALERAFQDRDCPEVIVHLAAVLPSTFTGPEAVRAAELNGEMDRNVFVAARALGAAVVYSSGASVYGLGDGDVKSESAPLRPIGPYAAGKLAGERAGEWMLSERGVPFTILRINAPYGPGQQTRTVLRIFVERALQDLPLRYHGTGSREQDFTHVDDVADAVVAAVGRQPNGTYNISGGRPISMKDLAELVRRCVPGCVSTVGPSGQDDPQEGATARYSIAKAAAELGWRPKTPLESGVSAWAHSVMTEGHEDRASR